MRLIHRLPIPLQKTSVPTPGGKLDILPFQIVVWVSLQFRSQLSERFPAVLDTGLSHNFTISEKQLREWLGTSASQLPRIGTSLVNGVPFQRSAARLAVYKNLPGKLEPADAFTMLDLPAGFVIHSGDRPRLPLLGLRALVRNQLRLTIDGKRNEVSLVKGWF